MRVLSFNILAPSARLCMPLKKVEWKERQRAVIATIQKLNPDIICLQEYDFVTPGFHEMYKEAFDTKYSIYTKRRPGGKPEGLAMFIRTGIMFTEIEVTSEVLPPHYAKRVIQIMTAKYKQNQRIIIGNTHLTVASSSNHYDIPTTRPMQAKRVLELIKETTTTNHDAIILCGDFNSDYLEKENPKQVVGFPAYTIEQASQPIYQIFQDGYLSAFHTLHPLQRPISHTCSYAQDGNTDYIFYKSTNTKNDTIIPKEAYLYPKEVPSDKVWNERTGWDDDTNNDKLDLMITSSDHRPLMTVFEFNNNNNNERLKKSHISSPLKKKHKTADKLYNEEKKIDQEEKRQLYERPGVPCLPC